jgi:type IV pilus assembly protein PilA
VAAELGLQGLLDAAPAAGTVPPPLPGNAAYVTRPAYAGAARHAPAPVASNRGLMIALVCIVAGVVLIAVMGILAAIALPAYSDYVNKSKLMQASQAAAQLRPAIARQWADGQCPTNESPGFQAPEAYASPLVESITIGTFEDGSCGLELRPRGIREQIDGKALWWSLEPRSQEWKCSSEIADRYLPLDCRG